MCFDELKFLILMWTVYGIFFIAFLSICLENISLESLRYFPVLSFAILIISHFIFRCNISGTDFCGQFKVGPN